MLFFLIMMNYKVKKSRRPLLDGDSRQAGQSERVIETRSRNSCQVAGWSKQGHRNSPPHFLPMGWEDLPGGTCFRLSSSSKT